MKKIIYLFTLTVFIFISAISTPISVSASTQTINFSGYTWTVRSGFYAPGPNNWSNDPRDVFVDAGGRLHLSVVNRNGVWYSSEVSLPSSLGYGTYEFDISTGVDRIDPNLIAAPFLYQDDTHEIDIEYTRWSDPTAPNTWMTVQPSSPTSETNFTTNQGTNPVTARIEWTPDHITLSTMQNNAALNSWTYSGTNNFTPGNERLHINFWQNKGWTPINNSTNEFIVDAMRFTPYQAQTIIPTPPIVDAPISSAPILSAPIIVEPIIKKNTSNVKRWIKKQILRQLIGIKKDR